MATSAEYFSRHPSPSIRRVAQQTMEIYQFLYMMNWRDLPEGGLKEIHVTNLGGLQGSGGFGEEITAAARTAAQSTEREAKLKTIFQQLIFGTVDSRTDAEMAFQLSSRMNNAFQEWLKQAFGSSAITNAALKFPGLDTIVRQNLGATGTKAPLTITLVDELLSTCNPQPNLLVFPTVLYNKFLDLVRAVPGISAISNEGYKMPSGRVGNYVMYRGVPMTYTNYIPERNTGNANAGRDIYALTIDDGSGVMGIGGVAKDAASLFNLSAEYPSPNNVGVFRNLEVTSDLVNYNQYSSARYYTVSVS